MKSLFLKLSFTIILLTTSIYSQEKPEARLIDEFGKICSEDLMARYDAFISELQRSPNSKGYIIFNGNEAHEGINLRYINFMKKQYPSFRGVDLNRIVLVRGENRKDMKGQFWLVRNDAMPPKVEKLYVAKKVSSPTMFQKTFAETNSTIGGDGKDYLDGFIEFYGCDFGPNLKDFAKTLLADVNLVGYVVQNPKSDNDIKLPTIAIEILVNTYKVPRNRLQGWIGGEYSKYDQIELWLVPNGQKLPRAFLVDDFGSIKCGDIISRMSAFMSELNQTPLSKGYVINNGDKNNQLRILNLEILLKGTIDEIEFDKERISFVRGDKEDSFRTQLWVVPNGSKTPKFNNVPYKFPLADSAKAFMFTTTQSYSYCPFAGYEEAYIEILESNPKAKGNIVIYNKNRVEFEKTKKDLISRFSEISTSRLRFFFVKEDISNIEYWIVPKKKRN